MAKAPVTRVGISIKSRDKILARFGNQLGALGEGKGRVAMARALNHTGRKANTAVKRALRKQTSIPATIIAKSMRTRAAAQQGDKALEFAIIGTGSELSLRYFSPRQFKYGVRARVWGKMQQFKGMFGAPGDNPKLVAKLGGEIFHRVGKDRFPIERGYGPSVPKEMIKDEALKAFEETASKGLEERLAHEIGRMLTG